MTDTHYVYILKCSDSTLYTGYTTNPDRRLKQHNKGQGSKYTRSRLPVDILYLEQAGTKSSALSREYEIKSLKREKKLKLIYSEHNMLNQKQED